MMLCMVNSCSNSDCIDILGMPVMDILIVQNHVSEVLLRQMTAADI